MYMLLNKTVFGKVYNKLLKFLSFKIYMITSNMFKDFRLRATSLNQTAFCTNLHDKDIV